MIALVTGTEVARLILDGLRLAHDAYEARERRRLSQVVGIDEARISRLERKIGKRKRRRGNK